MINFDKFVEGYLTGVVISDCKKNVSITLVDVEKNTSILELVKVTELMVVQFCMQNIIERISIWTGGSNRKDYENMLYTLTHAKIREDNDSVNLLAIDNIAKELEVDTNKKLIVIEPIYGALLISICEGFNLNP